MLKLPVKPVWIGAVGALIALLVGVKLALALASFVPANSPVGYVAQPDITSFNLKTGNEVLFRGQYEGEFWSGTLFAYPVSPNGALGDKSAYWSGSASEILDTQNFDSGRLIATMSDTGTAVPRDLLLPRARARGRVVPRDPGGADARDGGAHRGVTPPATSVTGSPTRIVPGRKTSALSARRPPNRRPMSFKTAGSRSSVSGSTVVIGQRPRKESSRTTASPM